MKRLINSTGRRRIERRHVRLMLRRAPGQEQPRIEADFELDELKLPPSARIILEAAYRDFAQRFEWGTVANPGPERDPVVGELPTDRRIFFRVKAVDASSHRLLALARRLQPVGENGDEGGRGELFRVRTKDLDQELWRVVFEDDGAPVLELNQEMPEALHDPSLRAAMLPVAMRTVLLHLRPDDDDPDEDANSWTHRWFRFATVLADEERPDPKDDEEAFQDWINRACRGFARRFALMANALDSRGSGG